jgi:hypothetical protein|tara:strand:+ start:7220 stop:7837 length:618 start_codon:yes stop_codon:yes gene_type:complete
MAGSTNAPYGMIQVAVLGDSYNTGGATQYPLGSNNTNAIFAGQPVCFSDGVIIPITATPTTTYGASTTPIGVASGFRYIDGSTGQLTFANNLVASAMTASGHSDVQVNVQDNPRAIFKVQADSAMVTTDQGKNTALTAVTGVNTLDLSKQSKLTIDGAGAATTATLAVRVVGLFQSPNNNWTDTYPDVLVTWNFGVHQYQMSTLA